MSQLRQQCLDLVDQMSEENNGNLFYVPDEDIEKLLSELNEDNVEDIACELAYLAHWYN